MAHAFDTGLPRAQRTLIRQGAIDLLSGLLRPTGYLAAVIPYGGVVRGYTDEVGVDQLAAALLGRSPSIAIAIGDRSSQSTGIGGFNWKGVVELLVYFFSSHPRDLELGRHEPDAVGLADDTADPGLDVIMEHAEELLVGQYAKGSPGGGIKQIRPNREEEIRTTPEGTLWVQRYDVEVSRQINAYRNVTQIVTELRSKVRTTDPVMAPPADPVVEVQSTTP